jgi:hypothetical protein
MLERRDIILSSEANYKQNADPEMKKASKACAKRATRATRSREPSTTSEPKRTAKGLPKKQSISGQWQQRQKQGAGAETGAGVSNIPVSQSSRKKAAINLAKRGEANDELHFDSVAELDAYFPKKGLKEMDAGDQTSRNV